MTSALVVEMQLAAGVPYHSLPSPFLIPPACEPAPPPLLLWTSAAALALLAPGQAAAAGATDGEQPLQHAAETPHERAQCDVATVVPSLIHVALRAVSGLASQLPVDGWWQPCAVHVQVEAEDEAGTGSGVASDTAQLAALSLMHDAASQWPLVKVMCCALSSLCRRCPSLPALQFSLRAAATVSRRFVGEALLALQVNASAGTAAA